MDEYSWPDNGVKGSARTQAAWPATCEALPVGTQVTGEVIGRQPFGVFLRIAGVPDAIGLAEITAMPHGAQLGTHVSGEVFGHAHHNYQVRISLSGRRPAGT
ncbi:hypothetical protein [Streptomyces albidoflavus]|uniref:hypothetical protein n=1 Tax=Streptomyces albidoflavus TaxID=1886 RepID=UPI002F90C113|nr:hypothetical protein OH730_31340 [Streptomyces albidoflavus]WTD86091.1 hypothetical protein OHA92_30665 [Streptomyces albidoflavus]